MSRPDDNGSDTDDFLQWVHDHPLAEQPRRDLIDRTTLRANIEAAFGPHGARDRVLDIIDAQPEVTE